MAQRNHFASVGLCLFLFAVGAAAHPPSAVVRRANDSGVFSGKRSATRGSFATRNFRVEASNDEEARDIAELAEKHRSEVSSKWLGVVPKEFPVPCTLVVSWDRPGTESGASTFHFVGGGVIRCSMWVRGEEKNVRRSTLRHEVAHVVLANHFGNPVPRWADEGIASYEEDQNVTRALDVAARKYLNAGEGYRLAALFPMEEYPTDALRLYAQGFSIVQYLVRWRGEARVVELLEAQRTVGWSAAVKHVYGFDSLEALQEAWINFLRTGK